MRLGHTDRALIGLAMLAVIAGAGCDGRMRIPPLGIGNHRPTVRITAAPIDTTVRCDPDPTRSCYALTLHWVGHDEDGRIDHFLYAIDPPSGAESDTTWIVSRENQERLVFPSREEVPRGPNELPVARGFHVFVIKAVDDRGEPGPPAARSFFSYTQAPDVYIVNPLPSSLTTPLLVPSVRISWTGKDEDGVFHDKPVYYKYRLFNDADLIRSVVANPDTLREAFAPRFAGWDSVGGDTTLATYTNLVPGTTYLFVVVAFDEAGAHSGIFNLDTNMLRFMVGYTGVLGPQITVFNEFFNYTSRGGWCPTCPTSVVTIEVPANTRITFNWLAAPSPGATIRCYRWGLDLEDANDETPRSDEYNDLRHWSTCALGEQSCTIGPFPGTLPPEAPEEHRLYVAALDDVDLRSLVIVRFIVVRASLDRPLLVVNDARLRPDIVPRGQICPAPPPSSIAWPNQAELDTFLYARGGVPWRCEPGFTSPRGVFSDYRPDTVDTRINRTDLTVPLSQLARYAHVVWIVDPLAALSAGPDDDPQMTALRYMTDRNHFSTLGAYVKQGGRVWLAGGGGAFASTRSWGGEPSEEGGTVFRTATLTRGRLMHDLAGWRSEFRVTSIPADPVRFAGRFESRPGTGASAYTAHLAELPARLEVKSEASDPLPPTRTRRSDFYRSVFTVEFLQLENHVFENVSGDPGHPLEESVLDTLYAEGRPRPGQDRRILMTYFHGPNVPQGFVFSGFDLWSWRRAHCQALVDFVLTRIWGVPRGGLVTRAPATRPFERAARPDRRPVAEVGMSRGIRSTPARVDR